MLTRRSFCLTAAAIAATPSLSFARPSRRRLARLQDSLTTTQLRPDVWGIMGGGGNSLLIKAKAGPVLIDTKVADMGAALLETCTGIIDRPPALVINTHHHGDHTGGNFAFSGEALILAHRNVKPRLAANLEKMKADAGARVKQLESAGTDPAALEDARRAKKEADALTIKDFAADVMFDDKRSLSEGVPATELRHYGAGHTDNDALIMLHDHNILHTGDLVFNEMHPYLDRPAGADTVGWQRVLMKAHSMCDAKTVVVPGHGEITDRDGLIRMHDYFDELREIVQTAMKEGKTKSEVARLRPDAFAGRGFARLMPRALRAMYEELE